MPTSYTATEILDQLNACANAFTFPMLDNGYYYLADTRLHAYRDETRWALIIEVLGANPRTGNHDALHNCLHCFGNCLERPPGIGSGDFLFVTDDGPEGSTFDEEYGWYLREGVHTIRIRDKVVNLELTPDTWAKKSIVLEEPPHITGAELLRSLVPEYRELLLATEEELRARIPPDLPLILRLDAWHHPDLARGKLPSESETFQMIAEVLVTADISRYRPTKEPNTHWTNWPAGGSL